MKYLHMHRLTHGRLKSRNCVVDERFVLKVSDYGLPMVLHSQNLDPAKGTEGRNFIFFSSSFSGLEEVMRGCVSYLFFQTL
jgi:hypothetical protein